MITSFVLIVIVILAGFYLYNNREIKVQENQSITASSPSIKPMAEPQIKIPEDWIPYTSKKYGFTIYHPADFQTDTNPEGDRLIKLGPTQSTGTELYDGLVLMIKSGPLDGKTIRQFADAQHLEMKNAETTQSITDVIEKKYGTHTAFQFRKDSLGEGDFIYLQKSPTEYLEVINMTYEPENSSSDFIKTAEIMISSLEF